MNLGTKNVDTFYICILGAGIRRVIWEVTGAGRQLGVLCCGTNGTNDKIWTGSEHTGNRRNWTVVRGRSGGWLLQPSCCVRFADVSTYPNKKEYLSSLYIELLSFFASLKIAITFEGFKFEILYLLKCYLSISFTIYDFIYDIFTIMFRMT